jgi:hypothetical protein
VGFTFCRSRGRVANMRSRKHRMGAAWSALRILDLGTGLSTERICSPEHCRRVSPQFSQGRADGDLDRQAVRGAAGALGSMICDAGQAQGPPYRRPARRVPQHRGQVRQYRDIAHARSP